ncbi:2-C-methyl-D-erythritol 4-phosphate cytidylyltransferase [Polynucleobacter sp. Latsch14-2]|uniref:2-C-methyl-D-erythritol 4-phosphate cytidylyltransferase n=1 Tax=Polynucleobacter sp. Latsch14-2 TaxID=2576920 RepID=UPI001C0D424C|nr:2-C-methyl-D-erythritol 4-phosphate cytidylyltransferase [Polynucleobacter sp. Latsch14-2]MBU3615292.1 2-C-methyl-D-erythritol 4-phosphate cytidylyltransferase [Polynucleobacter sp. Latsch14-2]
MSSESQSAQCHALLPTAGSGSRMGGNLPKQFQKLAGRPMLAYAIDAFCHTPEIQSVWVGINPGFIDNPILSHLVETDKPLHFLPTGGPTRQETVRNTLEAMMQSGIPESDWVLVHDAARPGISPDLIRKLIQALAITNVGGLLALPVADTLKLADLNTPIAGNYAHAKKTVSRNHLWQAQTPQMFPLKKLHDALADGIRLEADITDEASAMELAGVNPLLIEGAMRNFKITHPADWALMELLLQSVHQ